MFSTDFRLVGGGRLRCAILVAGTCLALAALTAVPSLAATKPITLAQQGRYPQVLVDLAGTAHIVWTEDNGSNADVLRYCRLKRGAPSCDNPAATQRLVPVKSYTGLGDSPARDRDVAGPRVLSIGKQLVLLSHRFGTQYPKPDGDPFALPYTTLMWLSNDGGNSFVGPSIIGWSAPSGDAVVFGPPGNESIATSTDIAERNTAELTGGKVQVIRPGAYTSARADFGDGATGSLAADGGAPVVAFDSGGRTLVRRWNGTGDPNDRATWSAPVSVNGTDPRLASGPRGLFVMTRRNSRVEVRKIDALTVRPAVTITRRLGLFEPTLFEGPSGRLFAAWGSFTDVLLCSSADGVRWSRSESLLKSPNAGQMDLGAARDGGGFLVTTANGAEKNPGRIVAVGFGASGRTGRPGLGDLPGGGTARAQPARSAPRVSAAQTTGNCAAPKSALSIPF
jgi:hypothetical protein